MRLNSPRNSYTRLAARCSSAQSKLPVIALLLCVGVASARADDGPLPIESDPLAWLKGDLSCEQLTDQIRGRYAPLGKFSDLPEEKKQELRLVLGVACSQRFAACDFKACAGVRGAEGSEGPGAVSGAPVSDPGGGIPTDFSGPTPDAVAQKKLAAEQQATAEAAEKARLQLDRLIALSTKSRDAAIQSSLAKENKTKATWQKIAIREDRSENGAGSAEASSESEPIRAPSGANRPSSAPVYSARSEEAPPEARANRHAPSPKSGGKGAPERDPGGYRDDSPKESKDGGGRSLMPRLR